MKRVGLIIKINDSQFIIEFKNPEGEDYELMDAIISTSLKERHNPVIKRLKDLFLVSLSEIAIYDNMFYNRFKKSFKSVREIRRRYGKTN